LQIGTIPVYLGLNMDQYSALSRVLWKFLANFLVLEVLWHRLAALQMMLRRSDYVMMSTGGPFLILEVRQSRFQD
jgi:hypothetical protein